MPVNAAAAHRAAMWRQLAVSLTSQEPNCTIAVNAASTSVHAFPAPIGLLPARFVALQCCLDFVAIGTMPRYHFHFRAGSSTFRDEVGDVFADESLALQHARRIALELARGGEPANAAIIVTEGDRQLFEVPLSDGK